MLLIYHKTRKAYKVDN